MNEKEFIQDVWDVLMGNTQYITAEQFREKYEDLFVQVDLDTKSISLYNDNEEWLLSLQKTFVGK